MSCAGPAKKLFDFLKWYECHVAGYVANWLLLRQQRPWRSCQNDSKIIGNKKQSRASLISLERQKCIN